MNLPQGLPLALSEAHELIRKQNACLNEQSHQLNEQSHQLNEQSTVITDQADEINYLKEQLRLAKMKLFARSSERFVDPDDPQYQLFDEMPVVETGVNDEDNQETEVSGHKRKRNRGKRASLPGILARVRVEHTLPESELIGPNGEQYEKIGEVISEQLEVIPAQVQVTVNVRFKYAVKGREELGILIAPVANQPIPKSIASASMLAHIAQSKYEYHLPLYRQERIWASLGIDIPRNSMCRWMMEIGKMLEPLNEVMFAQMKSHGHMHVDETPVTVLNKNTKGSHKGYMWVYANYHGVLYDYRPTRAGSGPMEMLNDYGGYIQTDRYSGYNGLFDSDKRISVACMAHARRKFTDIQKAYGKASNGICNHVLTKMQELYKIEKHAKKNNFSADDILQIRQSKAIPIVDDLHQYLLDKQNTVPPKSGLGKAIAYFLNHYQALRRYADSGIVSIDNNVAERAIKPFAVGRKNWLFCGNTAGAIAAANIYSLIEAVKMYNLKIFDYLKYVFEQLPNTHSQEDLIKLLPVHAQHYLPKMPTQPK